MTRDKRITDQMIRLYRLCHHDFGGLSYTEAAKTENISVRSVYRVLSEMRQFSPQLFPILNKEQAGMWKMWNDGRTCGQMALLFDSTEDAIYSKLLVIMRKLGFSVPHKRVTVRMSSSQMDELRPDEIIDTF